ncbi:MAG: ComF family protein [Desulfovibrionaceae bacterium]|nr:ComF family protein [Desulfovibrionaceae bacterium]
MAFHGPYDGDLREHILLFKLHRDLGRQHLLGALLADAYARAFFAVPPLPGAIGPEPDVAGAPLVHDLVVPVPLHAARLRWRGFNQSLELARTMLRVLAATARRHPDGARAPLPSPPLSRLAPHLLARVRHTTPQTNLPLAERQTNLKNAFAATDPSALRGKRILVVDDVATTCSTLHETARTLLRAGAARVDALVLARTQDRR